MVVSAFFALYLNNSLQAFGIILQIGIMRTNIHSDGFGTVTTVYSELTAMIVSFLVALAFEFVFPNNFSVEEKLIIGVAITTICWLLLLLLHLLQILKLFKTFIKIQPGGPDGKK